MLDKKVGKSSITTKFAAMLGLLVLTSCTHLQDQKTNQIENLLLLMEGTYVGETSNAAGQTSAMQDRRLRVLAPEISPYVIYWEVRTGPEQKLYRQRLLTYTLDEATGDIIQQTWQLNVTDNWPEKVNSNSFISFTSNDINSQLGELCVNKWVPNTEGWSAYLDPSQCRIWSERRERFRRIEGESVLTKTSLGQAERGYSDDGKTQEFGTPQGEFHLLTRQ